MKHPEVTSVGEILVDLVSDKPSKDLSSAHGFIKLAGGAPANVAVGLAKLGIRTSFLGKVGGDPFGRFLRHELSINGVNTRWLYDDARCKTRLAFVALSKNGDRDFEFWERDPADAHLRISEIDVEAVCSSEIIHISSFMLLNSETRKTAIALAKYGNKKSRIICFDPNIRLSLWGNSKEAITHYRTMIRLAVILRLNEEEAKLVTGAESLRIASRRLLALGPKLVVITRGKKGCFFATKTYSGSVKGFAVRAIDTTGCGDGFLAGLLAGIVRSKKNIEELSRDAVASICMKANAVGAIVATQRGAIAAMPSEQQVTLFLRSHA